MGEVREEFLQLARVDAVPDEAVEVEAAGLLQAQALTLTHTLCCKHNV
jgi:hypothetical protein